MAPLIVSVIGGVVQDLITVFNRAPSKGETVVANEFTMQPGGKGSNTAVAIHRLSRRNPDKTGSADDSIIDQELQVRMVGAVGSDSFGPVLLGNLRQCGINTDGVLSSPGEKTAVASIFVEADGGASRIIQYPGAGLAVDKNEYRTPEKLGGNIRPHFVVAHLELARDAVEQAIETAGEAGIEVLLNPSPATYIMPELYPLIAHLIMNESEADMMSPENYRLDELKTSQGLTKFAQYFHNLGVRNVIFTLEERGAYYSIADQKVVQSCGLVEADQSGNFLDRSGTVYVSHPTQFKADSGLSQRSG